MSYYKDQFGLLKTMPGIAEKTAKYLIAYIEYRMALCRQREELGFYSDLLKQTLKNPENLKMGFMSGNLSTKALEKAIQDNGKDIHFVTDPNNPRLVYYNSKDSEALLDLISQMQIQAKLDYENNRYIEEDYGFYNEKTGDFIPFRDEEGNYLDREGALHFGQFATEEQKSNPETVTDSLIFQGHQPGKVWYRDTNGNLHDDNGLLYEVMISDGHFYSDAINSALPDEALPVISQTEASIQAELRQVYAEINPDDEYIRTANGNMCNVRTGQIVEIRNEYGDKISESGQVTLNTRYAENYTSRVSQLHRGTVDTVSVYHFDPATGSFATEDRAQIVPLRSEAGFEYTKGYVNRAAGQTMYQAYHTTSKGHLVNGHGNDLILHNAYGDYYDKSGVFVTSNQPGPAIAERKRQLDLVCGQITEGNYRMTPKGLVKENGRDDNVPVRVYNQYGSYINEKTGLRVTSPAELDNGIALERVPGGFRDPESGSFIPNCSPYGDYYDADLDRVIFNTNIIGHEDYRKALVEEHEKNPADAGSLYLQDENGFIVKPETGVVITIFDDNGRRIGAENFVTIDELHQVFDEGLLFEEDKELNGFDERTRDEEKQEEQEAETGEEQPGETESEDQEEILIAEEEEKGSKRKTHKAEEQQHESGEYSEEYNAAADAYSNTEEIYATGDAEDTIITAGEYPSQTDNTASPEAVQTMASASEPVKTVSAEINEETEIPKADQTVNQVTAAEMKMPAEPVYENLSAADAVPTESISSTAAEAAAKADRPAPETQYEQIVTETASSTSPETAAQEVQPKPQLQTEGEAIHAAPSETKQGGSTTSTPQDIPYANVQTAETISNNAPVSSEKTPVESAKKPADGAAVPKQPLVNDETYYDDFVAYTAKLDTYEKAVKSYKSAQTKMTDAETAKNIAEDAVQNAQQAQYKAAEVKTAAETDYIAATSVFVKSESEYKTARQKYESAGINADPATVSRYEEARKSFESASAARTEAGARLQESQVAFTRATTTLNSAKFEYDQKAASFSEAQSAFNRAAETHSEARRALSQSQRTADSSFGTLVTEIATVNSTYRAVPRGSEFDLRPVSVPGARPSDTAPTIIKNGWLEKEGFRRLQNGEELHFHPAFGKTSNGLYHGRSTGDFAVRGQQYSSRTKSGYVTSEKAYGFNEMTFGKSLKKPSVYGMSAAISKAITSNIRSAAQEEGTTFKGATMVYPAAFHALSGVGGSAMLNNARNTTFNAFNGIRKPDGSVHILHARDQEMILKFANLEKRDINFATVSGIDKLHSSLVSVAAKRGLVEQRGGVWILTSKANNMTPQMLAELGLTTEQWKILKTQISTAAKAQSGAALVSGAWSLVRQRLRSGLTDSDETFRSAAQVSNTFSMGFNTAEMITKHWSGFQTARYNRMKDIEHGLSVQDKTSVRAFRKQIRKEMRNAPKADKKHINKKMQEKLADLRKRDMANRWQRAHRNALKKNPEKLSKTISKLETNAKNASKFSKQTDRIFHPVKTWLGQTKIYRMVSESVARSSIGQLASDVTAKISSFVASTLSALAPYLVIVAVLFLISGLIFAFSCAMAENLPMSAEVEETNTDVITKKIDDMYDKASTITGLLYNEIRMQELDWAYESMQYGTGTNEILLNGMTFTEQNVDPETYANSRTGEADLLGTWARDPNHSTYDVGNLNEQTGQFEPLASVEGILGDEPFDGAEEKDYKLLRTIDMGNQFELRGKPQEGKTSNAKQITAMTNVFYDQQLDALKENMRSAEGLKSIGTTLKYLWKSAWTWCSEKSVPILGNLGDAFGWSWTAQARDYAYPLVQVSHQENFFLSQYIMPTKYTKPNRDTYEEFNLFSRFDGAKAGYLSEHPSGDEQDGNGETATSPVDEETDKHVSNAETEWGNQSYKVNQQTGEASLHAGLGSSKEGGTGKITSKFKRAGEEGYEELEYCPETDYNGYGCQRRYKFYYKWPGTYAVSEDGEIVNEDALKTLYYGAEPYEDPENSNDVSADVSPWCDDDNTIMVGEQKYNANSCLLHIRQINDFGLSCWLNEDNAPAEVKSVSTDNTHNWETEGMNIKIPADYFKSPKLKEYLNSIYSDTYLQQVNYNGNDTFTIVVTQGNKIPRKLEQVYVGDTPVYAADGTIDHYEQNYEWQDKEHLELWKTTYVTFQHHCDGIHEGYYCGGHLQLRTRGVIYGFSEAQESTADKIPEGSIATYAPKFKDPQNLEAEEQHYGAQIEVFDPEDPKHLLSDGETVAYIQDAQETIFKLKDLFEVDGALKRNRETYPGMADETSVSDAESSSIAPWRSWTLLNMGQAIDMSLVDWTMAYNLADTDTMTGGLYKESGYSGINAVNDDVKTQILTLLGAEDVNMAADLDDNPKNLDGTPMSKEDQELVDRIRHIEYAMDCIGKVGYAQSQHDAAYADMKGHATDCSGFVSNIWLDRFGRTYTTSELATGIASAYTKDFSLDDIKPGDIILKNATAEDGSAHALIYVGTFAPSELYSLTHKDSELRNTTEQKLVFTIDCSTMTLRASQLPAIKKKTIFENTPFIKDLIRGLSLNANTVGGNVRFAARSYINNGTGNLQYIDVESMPLLIEGVRLTGEDYSGLGLTSESGSSKPQYWRQDAQVSHVSAFDIIRETKVIEFDYDMAPIAPVKKINKDRTDTGYYLPSDENGGLMGIRRDGEVVLPMYQYVNQGDYPTYKRGASDHTIKRSGCCDCSYIMCASYYNRINYNVPNVCGTYKYYIGTAFNQNAFFADEGITQRTIKWNTSGGGIGAAAGIQAVYDAIDAGHPVVLNIKGFFPSFHFTGNGHFLVIMGYKGDGFYLYDPGNRGVSYCNNPTFILPTSELAARWDRVWQLQEILPTGGQSVPAVTESEGVQDDCIMLAKLIHREAGGEPYEGKVAVAEVVRNRVKSVHFPSTVSQVALQQYQFSGFEAALNANDRTVQFTPEELEIARRVLYYGESVFNNDSVMYFRSSNASYQSDNSWYISWGSLPFYQKIGGHWFYRQN